MPRSGARAKTEAGTVHPPSVRRSDTSRPEPWLGGRFGLSAILLLLVILAYLPSTRNGFIYDDAEVILAHPAPQSLADCVRIFSEPHFLHLPYYRPVTRLTLLGQKAFFGDDPAPYHWFNVLLMGVAALLAYAVLRLPIFAIRKVPAMLGAALFALHPIASSCVNPVSSGRETLLPTVWSLMAIYSHLHPGRKWRSFAVLCFAGALFSKEQAAVLPLLFVLADLLNMSPNTPRSVRDWIRRYMPIAGIVLTYALIRYRLFGGSELQAGSWRGPLLALAYALQALAAPFNELVYEPTLGIWISVPRLALAAGLFSILVVAAFKLQVASRRACWFLLAWFVIGLLPTANLLRQEARFDERYVFFSSLAIFAVVASVVSALPERSRVYRSAMAVWIAGVAACLLVSYHRAVYFQDDLEFSEQWLHTDPNSLDAHYNLGLALEARKEYAGAAAHFEAALRIWPGYSAGHNNLGNALAALGEFDGAARHYEEAIRLNPRYADAHYNLGLLLAASGNADQAVKELTETLRLEPGLTAAQNNLGNLLAATGDLQDAISHFRAALRVTPNEPKLHNNLANVLATQGDFEGAIAEYGQALRIQPDYPEARRNLEIILNRDKKITSHESR